MTITNDGNGTYFNGNWLNGKGQSAFWARGFTNQVTSAADTGVGDFVLANRQAQGRSNGLALRPLNTGGWFEYTPLNDSLSGSVTSFASDLDSNADKNNNARLAVWLASNATDEQRIVWHTATSEIGITTSALGGTIYNFNFFNSTRRNWSVHTANSIGMVQQDNDGNVSNWLWCGELQNSIAGTFEERFVAFGNTDEADVYWGRTPNGGGNLYTLHVSTDDANSDYTVIAANGGSPSGTYVSDLYVKLSSGPSSGSLLGRCSNMFYGVGSFNVGDFYEIVPATPSDESDPSGTYFGSARPIYAMCIDTWGVGTYILMRVGDTQ